MVDYFAQLIKTWYKPCWHAWQISSCWKQVFCWQCVNWTKNTLYLSIFKWLFFRISRAVFAIHISISWSCATRESKKWKWAGASNHSYCWLMWKHYHLRHSGSGIFGLYDFLAKNTFRSGRWWRVVHLSRNILLETFKPLRNVHLFFSL